jgi:hypothetical protein
VDQQKYNLPTDLTHGRKVGNIVVEESLLFLRTPKTLGPDCIIQQTSLPESSQGKLSHKKTDFSKMIIIEEWCLLGSYAVWLL